MHRTQGKHLVAIAILAILAIVSVVCLAAGRLRAYVTGKYEVRLEVSVHCPLGLSVEDDAALHQLVYRGRRGGSVWSHREGMGRDQPSDRLAVGTTVQFEEVDRSLGVVRIVHPVSGWMYMKDGDEDDDDDGDDDSEMWVDGEESRKKAHEFFDSDSLVVTAVASGPVKSWNEQHLDRVVEPGHRIVAVNGVSGGAKKVQVALTTGRWLDAEGVLTLQLSRLARMEPSRTPLLDWLSLRRCRRSASSLHARSIGARLLDLLSLQRCRRSAAPLHARSIGAEFQSDMLGRHAGDSQGAELLRSITDRESAQRAESMQLREVLTEMRVCQRESKQGAEVARQQAEVRVEQQRSEMRKAESMRERLALAELRACQRELKAETHEAKMHAELDFMRGELRVERQKSETLNRTKSLLVDQHLEAESREAKTDAELARIREELHAELRVERQKSEMLSLTRSRLSDQKQAELHVERQKSEMLQMVTTLERAASTVLEVEAREADKEAELEFLRAEVQSEQAAKEQAFTDELAEARAETQREAQTAHAALAAEIAEMREALARAEAEASRRSLLDSEASRSTTASCPDRESGETVLQYYRANAGVGEQQHAADNTDERVRDLRGRHEQPVADDSGAGDEVTQPQEEVSRFAGLVRRMSLRRGIGV